MLFDDTSRIASVIRLLLFGSLSAFFAFSAGDAFVAHAPVTGTILVGLSTGATWLAGSEIWHLALWNNRDVTVDDIGLYVAGIELSVDWNQLAAVDPDPAGIVLRTTLARNDWVIPTKDPEALIKRIRAHPMYPAP